MKILLITPDNQSYIHYFPMGLAYISSILKREGYGVYIYSQDINHYPETHLKDYIERNDFNIIGIGSISGYYTYKKLLKISETINKCKNRKDFLYVLGGHMPSADPNYFLDRMKADVIVVGEGENNIREVCKKMEKGIYQSSLIEDLDSIPFPAYEKFPINYYRLQRFPNIEPTEFSLPIISGRGCSFHCNFCYRLMDGIRLRSINSIIDEIKYLKEEYNISYIDFSDDLTMTSRQRAIELSEALIPLNIKWRCEGRLNYATEEVLKIMKKGGCVFINYGIESLDNEVLKNMHKSLSADIIVEGVKNTLKIGISPGLNIIWGNIGDTKESLRKSVEFLLEYDDMAQLRTISPVTPFPGCELFKIAKERRLIKDTEDFYENKYVNSDLLTCNFTDLSDDEFYSELYKANFKLLSNYTKRKMSNIVDQLDKLYVKKDTSFRGWRHT